MEDTNRKLLASHFLRALYSLHLNKIRKIRTTNFSVFMTWYLVKHRNNFTFTLCNFYLCDVILRWLNVLKKHFIVDRDATTTLLFADDQIIIAE
jgi:hypothetical protein